MVLNRGAHLINWCAVQDIKGWAGIEHGSYFFGMLVSIPSRYIFDLGEQSTIQRQETATGWRQRVLPILVASAVCLFPNLNAPSASWLPSNGLRDFQLDVYSQVTLILVNWTWRNPKIFTTWFASILCLLCTYILVAAKRYLEEVLWPLSLTVEILVSP